MTSDGKRDPERDYSTSCPGHFTSHALLGIHVCVTGKGKDMGKGIK